ncbi:MAG: hypothetical protein M1151_03225 [Candidatus Thermoplasmatota archaeon]|jgi:hypothetical protein|nr:hypothetical protein [Candidatus Thermoplasmatota archaeon]MCL5785667.1 hypothetical protein [Candidatus Thermoplasmatota archaeon]
MPREKRTSNVDRIIYRKRQENVLKDIPAVLVPVWQIKLQERFGINVDREIASYVVLAAHERGTWKKHRAIKRIEKLLISRGETPEVSIEMAKKIVSMAVGASEP